MYLSRIHEKLNLFAPLRWMLPNLEDSILEGLRQDHVPEHLAITMDGNRRWAKKHNLSTARGHLRGAETAVKVGNGSL